MKSRRAHLLPVAGVGVLALVLTACGSSGGGSADAGQSGRGPITYVQGKDNNGIAQQVVDQWNSQHPDQKVTLKQQSDSADQQHDDLVQHFKAKDSGYDVVAVDVIWTSEFAAQGWLQPLTGKFALDTSPLFKAAVDAASYRGSLYAAPWVTDGGMLYYRKDLVPAPPKSWADLQKDCAVAKQNNMGCYAGQFAKYEGLTVNASEAINAAGGEIVGSDGKTPNVNTPAAAKGLSFLADMYKNGDIPQQAITFQEEQGRQAFESGQLLFLRNWPYVYSLASTDPTSVVKDKFGVAPLPGPDGTGASTLGGHNLGMSTYSKNKQTALDFMKFMESETIQREYLTKASNAPTLQSLYQDPQLLADPKLGFLKTLGESLATAKPRPVTPFYPAVSKAIEENAYAAIKGDTPVQDALNNMQNAIKSATNG